MPSLLALGSTLLGLLWIFRQDLEASFPAPPRSGSRSHHRARANLIGVSVLGVAYVVAAALGWPLGGVAVAGAALLVALDALLVGWLPSNVAHDVPFALLGLVVGLLLLVGGAEQAGLLAPLAGGIGAIAATAPVAGLPGLALGMAVLANLINNLPAALVSASVLGGLPPGVERDNLVAAVIVGLNLGPNLTTIGSLATMLWLLTLRRRGLEVSAFEYVRLGGLVTIPALLLAAAAVWAIGGLTTGGT